jgi:hypothetical protein
LRHSFMLSPWVSSAIRKILQVRGITDESRVLEEDAASPCPVKIVVRLLDSVCRRGVHSCFFFLFL